MTARRSFDPLPRPMWGLLRGVFDSLLLEAAKDAGATIHQPVRCESAERVDGGWRCGCVISPTIESISILAATSSSPMGNRPWANLRRRRRVISGSRRISTDVDGPRDTIELFATSGSYGGLAASKADGGTRRSACRRNSSSGPAATSGVCSTT